MATVTKVAVTIGRTVNLGNFNSLRLDVTMEAELSDEEREARQHREVVRGLGSAAREELERQVVAQLDAIQGQHDAIFNHVLNK